MASTGTLNVTLPASLIARMHHIVADGMYASSDELVSEALLEWSLRHDFGGEEDVEGIRRALQEVDDDDGPSIPMDEVFDRVEARCRAMVQEAQLVK